MLAIQMTFLAAGVIWGAVLLLRCSLLTACLAWLLCVVCFGRSFLAFPVGPVTMSLDRIAFLALVFSYLVHFYLGKVKPKPLQLVDYVVFALLACLTLSTLTHDFRREFFNTTSSPAWNLLAGYWMPITAYWIIRQSQLDETSIKQVQRFLFLLGIYLAVTGICEITGQWSLVFPRYIADPDIGIHFGRARGPFGNSIRYGVYVASGAFAAWVVWRQMTPKWQVALLPLAPLFLAAVFFCYTRSVWIGMGVAVVLTAVLTLRGQIRMLTVSGACIAALFVSVLLWDKLIHLEREESGRHAAVSVSNRAAHAYVSLAMFQDRPLFGFGFGQYPNEKLVYLQDRRTDLKLQRLRTRLSHNTLLTLLVEVGAVGLGLFIAVLVAWICLAVQLWRNENSPPWARQHAVLFLAVMCIYVFQLLFHEVTFRPDTNSLVFVLAATTVGLTTTAPQHSSPMVAQRQAFPAGRNYLETAGQ